VNASAQAEHARKVEAVAAQVRALAARRERAHVDKGGVHHVVPLPSGDRRFSSTRVDASALNRILEIDPERGICVAEPGVTFAQAVEATLRHGLVPAVVPELEGITLGGAVAGCSVESSSFREGGFHDTCVEYELVTGSGEVLTCSRDREPFLFEMAHGSYGTLGVLTSVTFRLIPAEQFVRLEYWRYRDPDSFHRALLERCEEQDVDFIDGIVHGPRDWVLCLGLFVDVAPKPSSYRRLNVYYKSTRSLRVDHLTTPDYFFRYDTEAHWLSRTVPALEWKSVRLLFGKAFLGSTNMIKWSKRLAPLFRRIRSRPDVVCDYFIPAARVPEFYEWYLREMPYFPLWAVPYRIPQPYPWLSDELAGKLEGDLFVDLAVYGMRNEEKRVDRSEQLEEKAYELGGIKTLISRNHYSPERFWSIYNRGNYRKAKERLDPSGVFPDLYDKLGRVG
jgi:FAD/FMN-containing dehydrogenase